MAQTPEGKVKDWISNKLKKEFPDIWIYKAPGGRFGRAGVPDLLCSIEGVFVGIEVKTDKGTLTQKQKYELDLLYKSGALTCVIYGKDEVVLNKLINEVKFCEEL